MLPNMNNSFTANKSLDAPVLLLLCHNLYIEVCLLTKSLVVKSNLLDFVSRALSCTSLGCTEGMQLAHQRNGRHFCDELSRIWGRKDSSWKITGRSKVFKTRSATLAVGSSRIPVTQKFLYEGDGTLTEGHIDFADMRQRTKIPQGDLFTVLEASTPEHIKQAMGVILDIEAEAAAKVSMKPGLIKALTLLRDNKVKTALVTRNTRASVKAFFDLIGPEWEGLFDPVLTREFPFVKPDKRLLLHVANEWRVYPSTLLMVGDSFEDVEVGNAAGTATCLVAGGGNEKPGVKVVTPAGAVATFIVNGLDQLSQMLEEGDDALKLGWPARQAAGEDIGKEGAPAPGLDFLDWCISVGAIRMGGASFPRMGQYAGGLATSDVTGSKILHVGCGAGGLTKTMCSQGMQVLGVDLDITATTRRGLCAVPLVGPKRELASGSLSIARESGTYEVVLIQGTSEDLRDSPGMRRWWHPQPLRELMTVLCEQSCPPSEAGSAQQRGTLCADVQIKDGQINPASIFESLQRHGLTVHAWQIIKSKKGDEGDRVLRLAAMRSTL
ncbi:hypothetical protein CEUSTIGMA_g9570.t1 [Chlamydomonas eustigma]|uniref:Uncharacterized protein n=1 Tax=Chlamydomonas eustigma TaxID=1157962 RepID=A0A250XGU7_9CHLO|nr:hypothetical protein CEUSTIGMA_g9570.t1 [Chlamydomonas eustigma]|eukprot:GAX82142.1 hypothetical protein CEUSTIGMA_g9570.t1 [Chlamydomonas eustigma]